MSNGTKTVSQIKVSLSGKLKTTYNVRYRVYVKNYGWMGWTENGAAAGSSSCNAQITGYQVKLVSKSDALEEERAAFSSKTGCLGSISGSSKADTAMKKVAAKCNMNLEKCYDWCVNNIKYAGTEFDPIRTATNWGAARIKGEAELAFGSGVGDCYTSAVAMYCLATYLGYDAECVAGTSLNATTETAMATSWCEVKVGGVFRVYDPLHTVCVQSDGTHYPAGSFEQTWKRYDA